MTDNCMRRFFLLYHYPMTKLVSLVRVGSSRVNATDWSAVNLQMLRIVTVENWETLIVGFLELQKNLSTRLGIMISSEPERGIVIEKKEADLVADLGREGKE